MEIGFHNFQWAQSQIRSLVCPLSLLNEQSVHRVLHRCSVFALQIGKLVKHLFEKWLTEHMDPGVGCPPNL